MESWVNKAEDVPTEDWSSFHCYIFSTIVSDGACHQRGVISPNAC